MWANDSLSWSSAHHDYTVDSFFFPGTFYCIWQLLVWMDKQNCCELQKAVGKMWHHILRPQSILHLCFHNYVLSHMTKKCIEPLWQTRSNMSITNSNDQSSYKNKNKVLIRCWRVTGSTLVLCLYHKEFPLVCFLTRTLSRPVLNNQNSKLKLKAKWCTCS